MADAQRACVQGTARSAGTARRRVNAPGREASVEDNVAWEATDIAGGGALACCWARRGGVRGLRSSDAQRVRAPGTARSAGAARRRVNAPGCEASVEDDAALEATKIAGGRAWAGCRAIRGRGCGLRSADAQRARAQGIARLEGTARRRVNAPGREALVEDDAALEATEIAGGGALARCQAMRVCVRGLRSANT